MVEGPGTSAPSRCARCRSPLEADDLRCAICGQAVPAEVVPRRVAEVEALVYRCTSCSAAVRYDPRVRAARCAFCGAVMEREEVPDPLEQTRRWLPFTIGGDEARAALSEWLGRRRWFRPSDLRSASSVESLRPLWWVAWVFDARASVTWAADSDAGAARSEWAPHAGRAELELDDILVSASRGLTEAETRALADSYQLATQAAEPAGVELEHATLESFDVQRSQGRARVLAAVESVAAREVTERLCPGTRHREVHVATLLRALHTDRLAFPAWVLAYRYGSKLYRVVVSGQDAGRVQGRLPLSFAKIAAAVALGLATLAAIFVIVLASA